ncbi:MAG: FKBP-type peptidyl-prolyl cis-trans isomerase [Prevotellaceae bacterium]|jgi:FKBP-type peptidyl-prolyl cis-trans isomerase FklB|nr:FKBP-type peptidyl-prolyl cis-trans isomerase [Prevotellaceae bacterium]
MKKTIIFSAAILATMAFVGCNNTKAKKVELKTENDSLSYAFGVSNGDQIRQYVMDNDTTGKHISAFFDGMEAGLKAPEEKTDDRTGMLAKNIGNTLGLQVKVGLMGDSTIVTDYKLIRQGLLNGMLNDTTQMDEKAAQDYLNTVMRARQEEQRAAMKKKREEEMLTKYADEKLAGEKFIAEIAKKPGIQKTENGVFYEVITQGKGAIPVDTSIVSVNYTGRLMNDTIFDSNAQSGKPVEFGLNGVIKGFSEALKIMPVGSKYRIYIPQELAYGAGQEGGRIPPFAPLIFDLELVGIKN